MDLILVIGRILFGGFFLMSGINHFTKLEAMTGYAKYKKLPAAKLGVLISGLMLVIGGLSVILGYYADLGALLLAIFLVLAAVIFHNFWKETDATAKQNEMLGFMKDIALAGAALILFALVSKYGTDLDFGWVLSAENISLWK
jgi:uncharacterized membrane protein YphA (DoxX/SURF4 family)